MPTIDIVKEVEISQSIRCQQLEAMFDCPMKEKCRLEWKGNLPIEKENFWNIGLILGPSGSGKSIIGKEIFKSLDNKLKWKEKSVIDDFDESLSVKDIASACMSVGFNTIPAWMRPYKVLSTGEKFRVEIARLLLESKKSPIVVDEFTSVVDRQVAQIGSFAVQKFIRKTEKKFVAISCHYDIIDWLMPDWIFEPASMEYKPRGLLQHGYQRPKVEFEIRQAPYGLWKVFAPFHYMSQTLYKGVKCFAVMVKDNPVAFAAVIHRPTGKNVRGISRIVTLPDWQGIGFSHFMAKKLGEAYKALGIRLRAYPAHPILIRQIDKMPYWKLIKKPGYQQSEDPRTKQARPDSHTTKKSAWKSVTRPGAVFEFCGDAMDREQAQRLVYSERFK